MASLDNLKTRLGIALDDASKDARLNVALTDAQAAFLEYCNRADIPATATTLIDAMAVVMLKREDSGHRQSESIGDYSYNNGANDWPKSITDRLANYRKVVMR